MNDDRKLILVKSFHTLIWVFFNVVLVYLFLAVIRERLDLWFWLGVGAIVVECAVLVYNHWVCPLTPIARKYSDSTRDNFDIYLPIWLARHNIKIYSLIALILVILIIYKYLIIS